MRCECDKRPILGKARLLANFLSQWRYSCLKCAICLAAQPLHYSWLGDVTRQRAVILHRVATLCITLSRSVATWDQRNPLTCRRAAVFGSLLLTGAAWRWYDDECLNFFPHHLFAYLRSIAFVRQSLILAWCFINYTVRQAYVMTYCSYTVEQGRRWVGGSWVTWVTWVAIIR